MKRTFLSVLRTFAKKNTGDKYKFYFLNTGQKIIRKSNK